MQGGSRLAIPVVPFVGRAAELRILQYARERASTGNAQCVLVEGEAGSGKTTLLGAFDESIGQSKPLWLTGDQAEVSLPYGIVSQVIDGIANDSAPLDIDFYAGQDPFTVGADLISVVSRRRGSRPLVVVLDDAHLVDAQSAAALTFAVRRLLVDPVLVVLGVRSHPETDHWQGLRRLAETHGQRLVLTGFSIAEIGELARATGFGALSMTGAKRLHLHTGGNPLEVTAAMSQLRVEQVEAVDEPLPVPDSVARLALAAVQSGSPEAAELAAAAAVLGGTCSLVDAASVAGLGDASAAADELRGLGILAAVEGSHSTFLSFRHELLRAAIYDGIDLVHRGELHTAASKVRSGAEALAHRAAAAAGPDLTLVGELRAEAQNYVRSSRWVAAGTTLIAAVRVCPSGSQQDRLLLEAVECLLAAGDVARALRHARTVDEMPATAYQFAVVARLAFLSGDRKRADELGRQAWTRADELEPSQRDALAALLAQIAILDDRSAEAVHWARRALDSGALPPELSAATRTMEAMGLALSGRPSAALELLGGLSDASQTKELVELPALHIRGCSRMLIDDLDAARADLEACSPSLARGVRPTQLAALGTLVQVEFRLGDWDDALAHGDGLVGLVEDTEQVWLLAFGHAVAALVPAARGLWEAARQHVEAARRAADMLNDAAAHVYADDSAVHLAFCRADYGEVCRSAVPLLARSDGAAGVPGLFSWQERYVAALTRLQRHEEARQALADMTGRAADGPASVLSSYARLRGELEAARRNTSGARTAFEEALTLSDGSTNRLDRAGTHASFGAFLRRRGERRNALEQLRLAAEIFERLGASPFLGRCEEEMAACGERRARPPDRSSDPELTPQETAVARLAVAGRRNREIADELVLSVKTIDYHLGHVYNKFGVRSRTELASRWAARRN